MIKVMHIGKYLPPSKGGMESSILHICRSLSTAGLDITLVGTAEPGMDIQHEENFKVRTLKTWWTWASTPFVSGLFKLIKDEKPDLIHLHLPNPWISLLLSWTTIPIVATYHCDIVSFQLLKKLYNPILHFFLKRCIKIIATSPQLASSSEALKNYQKKLSIISLSVPPLDFRNENLVLTERLNKTSKNIILFVGRLVSYKGLPFLIEAMKSTDGHLMIVGEGSKKESLIRIAQEFGVSSKITFAGSVSDEDLPSYYKAAKLIVLPSINQGEALGICLIEGLSIGRPLVTTELLTGVSYVNQNEITGLIVPPKDSVALATAIQRVLNSPAEQDRFSANAQIRYQEVFDLKKISEQHQKLYQEVLSL